MFIMLFTCYSLCTDNISVVWNECLSFLCELFIVVFDEKKKRWEQCEAAVLLSVREFIAIWMHITNEHTYKRIQKSHRAPKRHEVFDAFYSNALAHIHTQSERCLFSMQLFVCDRLYKQTSIHFLLEENNICILWVDRKRECTIWFVCNVHVLNGIIFAHFEMASCWDLRTQSWSIPHPPSIHFEQFDIRHTNSVFSVCLWLFALKIAQS